jgi:hypothetical protein
MAWDAGIVNCGGDVMGERGEREAQSHRLSESKEAHLESSFLRGLANSRVGYR